MARLHKCAYSKAATTGNLGLHAVPPYVEERQCRSPTRMLAKEKVAPALSQTVLRAQSSYEDKSCNLNLALAMPSSPASTIAKDALSIARSNREPPEIGQKRAKRQVCSGGHSQTHTQKAPPPRRSRRISTGTPPARSRAPRPRLPSPRFGLRASGPRLAADPRFRQDLLFSSRPASTASQKLNSETGTLTPTPTP